ncbi:MAG: hypothetical protein U1E65_23755 [Myxococcota bacterium]
MIEALLDGPLLELERICQTLAAEDADETSFDFERFWATASRLPSGLVHAEAVWITSVAPVGVEPLGPGSAWYALDRSLIVVAPPGRAALRVLVVDLARYALASEALARIFAADPALVEALHEPLDGQAVTRLALALGTDPERLFAIDRRLPSLRGDLAALAQRSFRPEVHLHPSTRPSKWRRLGESIGRRILDALPVGPFRLALSDAPELVEHLSPYLRDAGPAIAGWAVEHAEELSLPGLARALDAHSGRSPPADLVALAIPDLVRRHQEVLEERRLVERASGLELFDEAGIVFGFTELSQLPAADARAVPAGSRGLFVVIAGRADETLMAAHRVLLDSGRVEGLALAFAAGPEIEGTIAIPELLVGEDDAIEVPLADRLLRRVEPAMASRARRVIVDAERAAPPIVYDLLRLTRRAELEGLFPHDGRRSLVLVRRSADPGGSELERRSAVLHAARLALAGLHLGENAPSTRPSDASKNPKSLRFRA